MNFRTSHKLSQTTEGAIFVTVGLDSYQGSLLGVLPRIMLEYTLRVPEPRIGWSGTWNSSCRQQVSVP